MIVSRNLSVTVSCFDDVVLFFLLSLSYLSSLLRLSLVTIFPIM